MRMFHHPSVAGESEAVRTSANIGTPVADLAHVAQSGRLDSAGFAKFGQDRSTDVCQSRLGAVQFSREKICSGCAGSCAGVEHSVESLDFGCLGRRMLRGQGLRGWSLGGSAIRGWSLGTSMWGVFHGKSGQVNRGELNDMADGDRFAANGTVNDVSERMRTDGTQ